jgi:hypothetical protein
MTVHRLLPRTPFDFVQRTSERVYRSFATNLSTVDRYFIPARVINFSEAGFLLECDEYVRDGEAVMLNLPILGDIEGHVKWAGPGMIGGAFDKRVSTSVVMAALDLAEDDQALVA